MKKTSLLIILALALPAFALSEDYNLGEFAKAGKIEVFNRTLDQTKADSPEVVFLNAASGDGLAWITGVEFSEGTVELEIKGKNQPGRSFVGLAFHGQDNQSFDAVYLRPFIFKAANIAERRHSVQYISVPENHWNDLRTRYPGKYESAITPAPEPESWVKLKLVVNENTASAFINGSDKPALTVELLNDRLQGKVGLWVGNGSDGSFRNLKITSDIPPVGPAQTETESDFLSEFPPIKDREPKVTKRILRVVQDAINGTMRSEDYAPEFWAKTEPEQESIREELNGFGDFKSLAFAGRGTEGSRREYLYRLDFAKLVLLQRFVLNEENKIQLIEPEVYELKPEAGSDNN